MILGGYNAQYEPVLTLDGEKRELRWFKSVVQGLWMLHLTSYKFGNKVLNFEDFAMVASASAAIFVPETFF